MENTKLLKAELIISQFLRIGVMVSAAFLLVGLVWSWFAPHSVGFSAAELDLLMHGQMLPQTGIAESASALFAALLHFDPSAIIELGLVLLIALPIGRVALTVIVFLLERDYLYFFLTCVVLGVLVLGLILGKAL